MEGAGRGDESRNRRGIKSAGELIGCRAWWRARRSSELHFTNGERMTEQEEIDTLRSVSRVFAFSERGEPFKKTFSFEGKTVERMVMEVGFAEYNERGSLLCKKGPGNIEAWYEYDEHGKKTHSRHGGLTDKGEEFWYDRQGRVVREKDDDGNETWHEYDERGNIIHRRNSDGYEGWFEYNDAGQPLREKHVYPAASKHNAFSAAVRSYAKQEREKYEASLPHAAAQKAARDAQDESSDIEEVLYEYDESGRLLSKISDEGAERHEYDGRGNETYRMVRRFGRIPPKDYAEETWYEYDDCGRVIRERNRLFERCYDYGTDGMTKTVRDYYHHSGMERWIETERWANGKQKRRAEYMAATKKNPDIQLEL